MMFRMLKGWLANILRSREAPHQISASDSGIQLSFNTPSKSIECRSFQDLGLIKSDAAEWIMPIIKNLHAQGTGYMVMVREIRNQGEQLSREEKKVLSTRANVKLGRHFVESLTEKGRANPAKTADELIYANYSIPLISANANELRGDSNFKFLHLMVDNSNENRVCANAKILSKKGRILRTQAPSLPLNECNKRCSCWYFVDDQCVED